MFLDGSRYAKVPTEITKATDGRTVVALMLRRLPPTSGSAYEIKDNDRLDLLAQSTTGDGTRFWRIADANSALDAADLTARTGDTLALPAD